jgi:hypothetical protein
VQQESHWRGVAARVLPAVIADELAASGPGRARGVARLLLVAGSGGAGGSSRHGRTSRVAERRGVDRGAFALDGVEDLELVDPAVDDVQPTSTS